MQKNQLLCRGKGFPWRPTNVFLIMRLTAYFTLFTCLHVAANGYSQDARVSLKLNGASVQSLFRAIEKRTSYRFVYSNDIIPEGLNVSIDVQNTAVSEVLGHTLDRFNLDFRMMDKEVIVVADRATIRTIAAIRGKVADANGAPLEGVSITIKGASGGAFSDAEGNFSINIPGKTATLVFSYIGLETQLVPVRAEQKDPLQVIMKGARQLSTVTVVNTGYQVLNKERATGAFGYVSREQLDKPTSNIATRIIGTNAGVQAKLDVDGNPTFEIRGQTSLNTVGSAAAPLVIVDGFPIQGDFSSINPNDVESITILKDAAAASIWGARSGNGVIVVVTKNARRGTPLRVEFSAFTKIGSKFDLDYVNPLATSAETVDYEKRAFNKWSAQTNSGSLTGNVGKSWSLATMAMSEQYLGFITAAQRDAILEKLKTQSNKQQIKDLLLANPATQQYNLNISGSSGRMSNILSLLYESNQSNFKESHDKKYMANLKSIANIFPWLDLHFSSMVQYRDVWNNGVSLQDIQSLSPYELLKNPDGSLTNIYQYYTPILDRLVPTQLFPYKDWTYNPLQEIANREIRTNYLNTRLQAGLTFKLMKGLAFDSKVQYELFNTSDKQFNNENTFYVRNIINTSTSWNQATNVMTPNLPKGGILAQSRSKTQSWNFRNQLSFSRRFGKDHEVNATAGMEANNRVLEGFANPNTYGYNDQTLSVGLFPNGPGGTFKTIQNWLGSNQTFNYVNSFSYRTERFLSYFANAAYTYRYKYTLSASYRTDASNMIADDPKYRYSPFWSVGGAWQLHKEELLKNISWLGRLNLRATYGYNGNVDRTTAFQPLIATGAAANIYTNEQTATISSFGNPTLRWEKTGTWNLGVDYSLFSNRLFGKVDVYNKKGKDLIAQLSIPAVNGTTSQKLNNAEMVNRGVEIELGSVMPISGRNIVWEGNLNFSYNRNRITRLFVATYAASTLVGGGSGAYVEGANATSLWRFEYAGIQNTQPMVKGPKGTMYDFGAFTPGDGRDYLVNTGTTVAPYTLGFMNAFKIYNFDLSFIITGKFGHVFQRQAFNYPPVWGGRVLPNSKITEVLNGDPNKIVPLPYNDIEPRYYFWDRFHQYLSYLVENASHVRMQEVNLSYSLGRRTLSRINFSRLQLFVQGNDLFTVYANKAKEDPEYLRGTMKPRPKFTFGLKCEL